MIKQIQKTLCSLLLIIEVVVIQVDPTSL